MISNIKIHKNETEYIPEDVNYSSSSINLMDNHLINLIQNKKLLSAMYTISRAGKTIVNKSMGKLRYNSDDDLKPDSIRRIASITKFFTAVGICKLVEEGKIRLDQSVSEIIEEFKNPMYEGINIFHLLTHTSGIRPDPDVFFEPYPLSWEWGQDWLKNILTGPLAIKPGLEWRYSSTGFTILGEIISRVSGMRYDKYIVDNILKPLNMEDSFFIVPEAKKDRVCLASEFEEKWFNDKGKIEDWHPPRAGGGLFSTPNDLQKFGNMMLNKGILNSTRVISKKTVETMTRKHLHNVKSYCWGSDITMEYGLGINVWLNDTTFITPGTFSHEGAGLSGLFIDPVEKLVLSYFCVLLDDTWVPEAVSNIRNLVWSGII